MELVLPLVEQQVLGGLRQRLDVRGQLEQLEAGQPVTVWAWLVGTGGRVARLWPDGDAVALPDDHPDAVDFLTEAAAPLGRPAHCS